MTPNELGEIIFDKKVVSIKDQLIFINYRVKVMKGKQSLGI